MNSFPLLNGNTSEAVATIASLASENAKLRAALEQACDALEDLSQFQCDDCLPTCADCGLALNNHTEGCLVTQILSLKKELLK